MPSKTEGRKLTDAERRRLEAFEALCARLEGEGWSKHELTVDPLRANVTGTLYGLAAAVPFLALFLALRGFPAPGGEGFMQSYLGFMAAFIVLIVVHELVHGLTWSLFAPSGFKSIEFGVIWKSLNPYCTCSEPLARGQYVAGGLMPCIVLGIIPSLIACFTGSGWLLGLGLIMIASAGGDLLICKLILDSPGGQDSLYLDHPTDIGLMRFDR